MDDCLWNTAKKLVNHDGLVVLWNRVKCLLNDVASESIHRQVQGVAANGVGNLDDLLRSSVFKASLNQEVSEAIDHQRIGLCNNCLNDLIFLLRCADLELLLKEDGSLLVIVADNLVNNVLPVAVDSTVKKTTVVERLSSRQVGCTFGNSSLVEV